MNPGRILYLLNGAPFFLSHRLALARMMKKKGWDVHVAAPFNADCVEKIQSEGFHFHTIKIDRKGINPLSDLCTIFSLARLYYRVRPTLVHHLTIKPVLYGGFAARMIGIKGMVQAITGTGYVFTSSGFRASCLRTIVFLIYRFSLGRNNTVVIFQNPDDQKSFIKLNLVEDKKTVLIRGSGVDVSRFRSSSPPPGLPIVIFAGRLLWDKGVGVFVDASILLKRAGSKARFVIVGEPDSENPESLTKEQLQEWNDAGTIEWWGQRNDMEEVLAQCSVFCYPSYYGEGIPKVLLEAAACARPIVTTDAPGCREVVQSGLNGYLVPVKDAQAVANALEALLANEKLRMEMGQASRVLAENNFSIERILSETLLVYEKLTQ